MKPNVTQGKPRILATKKSQTSVKKEQRLDFVEISKEEIKATRNSAYKYLIQ